MKELYDILKPAIKKELEERDILLLEEVNKLLKEELKSRTVVTEKTLIKQLNVSRQTLNKWRREGKIPYYRINYDFESKLNNGILNVIIDSTITYENTDTINSGSTQLSFNLY